MSLTCRRSSLDLVGPHGACSSCEISPSFSIRFQLVHAVAPDVAHGNPGLFGVFAGDLGQLLTPFFGQRRGSAPGSAVALGLRD